MRINRNKKKYSVYPVKIEMKPEIWYDWDNN